MFDHVTIRVSDRAASQRFYETVLATLGLESTHDSDDLVEWGDFSLAAGRAVTRRLHIGFVAPSRAHVDAFWRAGVDGGYENDGEPGPRPQYADDYYGAFLLDPDGNSAEAVHHGRMGQGTIDHLWIRVPDLGAAADFYGLVAPHGGFRLKRRDIPSPPRAQFVGDGGSFSVVDDGQPTENVHLAFAARANEDVDAFHRALVAAGHRSNGEPGERAVYHPGYYAAFVLDPAGNNVEVVNHNR